MHAKMHRSRPRGDPLGDPLWSGAGTIRQLWGEKGRAEGEKLQDQLNELEIVRISVYRPNWSEIALVQAFAVRDL